MLLSIGLMSGTSMDGVDAALLQTDGEANIHELGHCHLAYPSDFKVLLKVAERAAHQTQGNQAEAAHVFPQALKAYLQEELSWPTHLLQSEIQRLTMQASSLAAVIQQSTDWHARAVAQLLKITARSAAEIDVIGYHGQTLYHSPRQKISWQMGDGALLAKLTGIQVIDQFRQQDIQAGGEGAPFAPVYHFYLAKREGKIPAAVVNCGGIANLTLIRDADLTHVMGFDTGPGNGLIDALVKQRTQGIETMDRDGHYGQRGTINPGVLQALWDHAIVQSGQNYFKKCPPKSLDIRDLCLIPELNALSLEDACATLEAWTALTIVQSLQSLGLNASLVPRYWILAGGGWYNPVIRHTLESQLHALYGKEIRVQTADEMGWNSQALEAQIFAHFAVRSLKKLPLSLPGTTRVPTPLSGGTLHPKQENEAHV